MNVIPFAFDDRLIRVVIRSGEPWFVLADVCRVLDINQPHHAAARLDDDEKATVDTRDIDTGINGCKIDARVQQITIISESGLYALVMTSRKPEAKRFRKWVTAEVLPSLRKTGSYSMPGALPPSPPPRAEISLHELRQWTNAVREARILRGSATAVALWNASPLAGVIALPDFPAGSLPGGPGLDPEGCLAHLLALPVRGHGTLADAAAAHWAGDAVPRAPLRGSGVLLDPPGWPGTAAIGNRVPALSAHFVGTPWAAGWDRALANLPGAARAPKVFWFGDRPSRVVLVPRGLFGPDALS